MVCLKCGVNVALIMALLGLTPVEHFRLICEKFWESYKITFVRCEMLLSGFIRRFSAGMSLLVV